MKHGPGRNKNCKDCRNIRWITTGILVTLVLVITIRSGELIFLGVIPLIWVAGWIVDSWLPLPQFHGYLIDAGFERDWMIKKDPNNEN